MTALNKQALRQLAEKATPGPWEMEHENIWFRDTEGYTKHLMYAYQGDDVDDQQDYDNTAYIAAFNPKVVLALLDELEAAQSYAKDRDEENQDLMLTVGRLRVEREASEAELNNALCELLPGTQYMDPPDGGSVTPLEQVRRMVADYRDRISNLESRKVCIPRISNDEFWLSFNNRIFFREETYRSAVIKSIEAAGIGVKGE
ncbi:ead/Ea22-like family protein [Citrobacter freundii]|uniref:ead/Ea22-like family protein n=1 Tax=Citrobacter freundii TaxID=546 RepID=UPI001C7D86D3|nr:ead/Ea22-like family protein [Citrobacter freundii]